MAPRTATIALALLALSPAIVFAERSVGVTPNSDTKTCFVWTGADKSQQGAASHTAERRQLVRMERLGRARRDLHEEGPR